MVKEKGTTVLTDKGFGIEDLCHSKGLLHNRPPMKMMKVRLAKILMLLHCAFIMKTLLAV